MPTTHSPFCFAGAAIYIPPNQLKTSYHLNEASRVNICVTMLLYYGQLHPHLNTRE